MGLYSSSDKDMAMFIFNSNKAKFDFMFGEDNVLQGKKNKPFKKYFSFKQISHGKYFLVCLICKSKLQSVYISRHTVPVLQK